MTRLATPAPRQAHLAAMHMAQKKLGLSADDARALKLAVTGVASAADMTPEQRRKYLAHLSGLQGFAVPAQHRTPRSNVQRSAADDQDARWRKARALWAELARAGAVHVDTDAALQAYVMRQTKVEHWRFLNGYQVNGVIEALKKWQARLEQEAPHG